MPKLLNEAAEMVAIGRLIPHPRNINQGDFGAIMESMEAHGFFGSLVVQKSTRHILAGNHRFAVAKQLGYSELPVSWVDCDDEQALRLLLVDNRTGRLGNDNPAKLAELLAELAVGDDGLLGTGYDGDFLDDLIKDLAPKDPPPPKAVPAKPKADEEEKDQSPRPGPGEPDYVAPDKGRLGVIVLCDNEDEQGHILQRIVDIGWNAQKTVFSEQAYTRLKTDPPYST